MDISAANWSEDDNANTTAAPDGAPEGMAPSGVNNVLRAHQGALKRFYNWTNPKITGGSGTAYTLSYAMAPGALVDGMTHLVQFNAINGNAPTLNVNALGAVPLQYYSAGAWRALRPACWTADVCRVAYNAAAARIASSTAQIGRATWCRLAGSTARAGTSCSGPGGEPHRLCWSVRSIRHDLRSLAMAAPLSICLVCEAVSWPAKRWVAPSYVLGAADRSASGTTNYGEHDGRWRHVRKLGCDSTGMHGQSVQNSSQGGGASALKRPHRSRPRECEFSRRDVRLPQRQRQRRVRGL